ncbi:MAG: hypothetical protein NPINA01_30110 [Nitrospinaceae bacterium]|nr:MAG: hypothetical protein NPINA01_30110 [Nitrospinaceae bacterium]
MKAQELIITNGDSAVDLLKTAKIGDHWLPWRDVLHEGPVPLTDDLDSLSLIRAKYLADKGWTGSDQVENGFKERDDLLADVDQYESAVLWFEHDLYDQLQLLQILDFIATHPKKNDEWFLVQADDFLGTQTPQTIGQFLDRKERISAAQLNLAEEAWRAFRQPTPLSFAALLEKDLSALPFLKPSVLRMLEELPALSTGLLRSERQIISLIDRGVLDARELFRASQKMEEAQFMGDWSFFDRLMGLVHAREPLISGLEDFSLDAYKNDNERKTFLAAILNLTAFGEAVLSGEEDHARRNDIHFWWGGTELSDTCLWRWDCEAQQLIAP